MKAGDINSIASAVVASLAGQDPGVLGCGAVSSTIEFDAPPVYACTGEYECGGAAWFNCEGQVYNCVNDFLCSYHLFQCNPGFACQGQYTM